MKSCANKSSINAVAPDWNLKHKLVAFVLRLENNAVAPDWNLKYLNLKLLEDIMTNAVAPDWNLKIYEASHDVLIA